MSSFFKNFREKDFSKISEDECIKFEAFMNMKALLDIGRQKFINFVKQVSTVYMYIYITYVIQLPGYT